MVAIYSRKNIQYGSAKLLLNLLLNMLPLILSIFVLLNTQLPVLPVMPDTRLLAVKTMSLNDRNGVETVNSVFKQNILLTLAYMQQREEINTPDMQSLDKPFHFILTLHKGEVFAFHDKVLPEFDGKVTSTTNAHFNPEEGFISDGYLYGDGVCHLASLIDYAATSAGLDVIAPTSHAFADIPGVPEQYEVSIYTTPSETATSAKQNLYITNNFSGDVALVFEYQNSLLKVSILKQST